MLWASASETRPPPASNRATKTAFLFCIFKNSGFESPEYTLRFPRFYATCGTTSAVPPRTRLTRALHTPQKRMLHRPYPSTSTAAEVVRRPQLCHPACPGVPWERSGSAVPSQSQPHSELSIRITNAKVYQGFKLVIPTGAKRRGGTCSFTRTARNSQHAIPTLPVPPSPLNAKVLPQLLLQLTSRAPSNADH